jgi:hypothetical protein
MSTRNDGGPAFPSGENGIYAMRSGMTLRDWFAGQVLAGLLADGDFHSADGAAACAYEYADAMLAERDKDGAA